MDLKNIFPIILDNLLTLFIGGIPLVIIGYLLGVRQSNINWRRELQQREREMQLLRDQLEEQKKQREFTERVHEEGIAPKQNLFRWNVK